MRARTQLFKLQIDPRRIYKGMPLPAGEKSVLMEFQAPFMKDDSCREPRDIPPRASIVDVPERRR